jgi:hypothetical protein
MTVEENIRQTAASYRAGKLEQAGELRCPRQFPAFGIRWKNHGRGERRFPVLQLEGTA